MSKISTKYLNQIFQYLNVFEEGNKSQAFASQIETVEKAFIYVKELLEDREYQILDLGCAAGNVLFTAKSILGDKHKYVGIDYNQKYIEVAKAIDGEFHLLNVDLLSTTTKEIMQQSDIIYCYYPLSCGKEMMKLYNLIRDNIKDDTILIINDLSLKAFPSTTFLRRFEGVECCNKTDIKIFNRN